MPEAGLITKNKLVVVTWQMGITGGRFKHLDTLHHNAKLNEVVRLARGELRREPLLIYAAQTLEVRAAVAAMDRLGGAVCVWGGLDKQERDRALEKFQRGRVRHLVANPAAMRMGVDASRSSTVFYLSNTWSAETRAQSEDRPEHPKKKDVIAIYDVVVPGEVCDDCASELSVKRNGTVMTKRNLVRALMRRKETT